MKRTRSNSHLANLLRSFAAFLFMIMLALHFTPAAQAQNTTLVVNKKACAASLLPANVSINANAATLLNDCANILSVSQNSLFYYVISVVDISPTGQTISVSDSLPAGFSQLSAPPAFCIGCSGGTGTAPNLSSVAMTGSGNTIYIVVPGYFTEGGNHENTAVVTPLAGEKVYSPTIDTFAGTPTPPSGNLKIEKTADVTSASISGGSVVVNYTITVTNTGVNSVTVGDTNPDPLINSSIFELVDNASALLGSSLGFNYTVSPVTFTGCDSFASLGTGNISCPDNQTQSASGATTNASTGSILGVWTYAQNDPGVMAPGSSYTLSFQVEYTLDQTVKCVWPNTINGVRNTAYIRFATGQISFSDTNPNDNTSFVDLEITDHGVLDECVEETNKIEIKKIQKSPLGEVAWGAPVTYIISVTNTSTPADIFGGYINNISVSDVVTMLPGMPVVDVTGQSASCLTVPGTATCTINYPPPSPTATLLTYYASTPPMASATINNLGPGETVEIVVELIFKPRSCMSYNTDGPRQTANVANYFYSITGKYGMVFEHSGGSQSIITDHEKVPACTLKTEKTQDPSVVTFGSSIEYQVTYENYGSEPIEVGTLIDAISLSSNVYASPGVSGFYTYGCAYEQNGIPLPWFPNAPLNLLPTNTPAANAGLGDAILVSYNSLPGQGTKLLKQLNPGTPIIFPPKSKIICDFKVILQQPTSANPYCQGAGEPKLVNHALMDASYYFNTNYDPIAGTPPPSSPVGLPESYATTEAGLPLCHQIETGKTIDPMIAEPGETVTVTLTLQNEGDDPITGATLTDTVPNNLTPTGNLNCPLCNPPLVNAPISGQNISVVFGTLAAGEVGTVTFDAKANPPTPQVDTNHVDGNFTPPPGNWYDQGSDKVHDFNYGIFDKEPVTITKQVVNMSPQPFPLGPFPISVSCTLPGYPSLNWSYATIANATIPSGSTAISVTLPVELPVGAVCTFTETSVPAGTTPYGFSAVGYEPAISGGLSGSMTVSLGGQNNGIVENCYGLPGLPSALQQPHVVGKDCPPVPVDPPQPEFRTEKICTPAILAPNGESYVANCEIIVWTSGEFPAGYSVQENFGGNGQVDYLATISTPSTMTWGCTPTSTPAPGVIDCAFTGGTQQAGGPNQASHHFIVTFRGEEDVLNSKNCAIATINGEGVGEDCEGFVIAKDENKYDIEKVCGEVRSSIVFVPEMGNVTSNSAECVITVTATPGPVIGLLSVSDTFTSVPNSSALITSLTGAGWTCNPTPSTTAPITAGTPFTCTMPGALYPTYSDSNGQSTITATVSVPLGEDRVQNCATLALNDDRLDTSCGDIIVNTTPKVEKSCAAPYQSQGTGNWLVNCTITVTPTGPITGSVILNDVMSLTSGSATITTVNPGIWTCTPNTPITTPNAMSCSASNLTGPSTINLTMSVVPGTTGLQNCAATVVNQLQTDRYCENIVIPPEPRADTEKRCDPVVWDAATQRFKTNCTITVSASGYSNGTITIVEHMSASGGTAQIDALTQSGWTCNPATIPPAVVGTNFQVICHRPAAGFTNDTINVDLSFPQGTQGVKNCAKLYWSPQPIGLSQLPQTPLLDKSCPFLTPVEVPPVKADIQKTCTDATLLPAPNSANAYGSTCTVTVTTSGPVQTPISFTENLFATGSTSFVSSTPAGWACVPATVPNSTTMNCTYSGVVNPVSNTWDVTFSVTFPNATTANNAKNCVRLSTGNVNWNTDCHGFVAVAPTPFDLGATKSCVVYQQLSDSMSILDCTITVTANGSPFPPVITLTENLQSTATNAGSFMNLLGVGSTDAWTCPPSGTPVGPNTPINCTIPGSSFPASGTSVLHAYMTYNSSVTPGLTQNCVTVAGNSTPPTSSGEICVPIGPPAPTEGRLAIIKQATLNGQNIPQQDFPFTVTCGSTVTNVDVQNDGGVGLVTSIPFGTSCTVVENQPPLTGVCPVGQTASWSTTYSPATLQPFTAQNPEQTVTVLNTLTCTPSEPPIYPFVVKKVVVNNAPGSVAGLVFPITVSCPNRPNSNVLTTNMLGGNSGVIYGSVLNDSCTISEGAYPATTACGPLATPAWTTVISPSSPITVGTTMQTVTVKNTLNCVPIVVQLNGRLTVKKVVVAPQGVVVPASTNFPVTVNCGTAQNGNISVNTSWSLSGLSTTAACTVTENVSTLPTTGICPQGQTASWSVSPPTQSVAPTIGGVTAIITNKLICTPAGRLQVKKVVDVPQGVNITAVNFPVTVNCGGNQQTGTISVNTPWILNGLATNASCFVQEQAPPTANICPPGQTASWSTIYTPPSQTVTPTAGGVQVKILNTLKCTPIIQPTGALTVTKTCAPATPAVGGGVDVSCTITANVTGGPAPDVITLTEKLDELIAMNPGAAQITSLTSTQPWTFPSLPLNSEVNGQIVLNGSDLPSSGESTINVTMHFADVGMLGEVQNCVSGASSSYGVVAASTPSEVCVLLNPPTLADGSLAVYKICSQPNYQPGSLFAAISCTVTVTGSAPYPPQVNLVEALDGWLDTAQGVQSIQSSENWICQGLPTVQHSPASCTLTGAEFAAVGGTSTLAIVVHTPWYQTADWGSWYYRNNCANAFGTDISGTPLTPPMYSNRSCSLLNTDLNPPLNLSVSGTGEATSVKCGNLLADSSGGNCQCKLSGMVQISKTECACPTGQRVKGGRCTQSPASPPKCDRETTKLVDGQCLCTIRGMKPWSKTECRCLKGQEVRNGQCRDIPTPPPPAPKCDTRSAELQDGKCVCKVPGAEPVSKTACGCPDGTELIKGKCRVPPPELKCDTRSAVPSNGKCVCKIQGAVPVSPTACGCPDGTELIKGKCRVPAPVLKCDRDTTVTKGSACVCKFRGMRPVSETECACRRGSTFVAGKGCVVERADCPEGTVRKGDLCIRIKLDEPRGKDCPPGTRKVGPLCVRVKLKDADPAPENPAGPGKLCLDREGKEVPCD